ncbi:MAG: DsbA family protein [Gemmatimonadota bacterium]
MASRVERGIVGCGLAVALLGGCGDGPGSAQESTAAVVPSSLSVVVERADRARVRGAEEAPVRLVEISDFQCPFCAQFFHETYAALDSLYVQTGKVSYVWISFPNPSHPYAWPAIEAAFCAGTVGKFWQMHDLLFERQKEWSEAAAPAPVFAGYARELNIDADSYTECLDNDRVAQLQVRDYQSAIRAGINSTPFFILADSVAIRGAAPLENFQKAIDDILAALEEEKSEDGGGGGR